MTRVRDRDRFAILRLVAPGVVLLALLLWGVSARAGNMPDMDNASHQLGIRMLRPNMAIKAGNQYIAIVDNPVPLARLGLAGLKPGDRVICRFVDDAHLVLYDARGNHTGPIHLDSAGTVLGAEQVQQLNSFINRQHKKRRGR